ncbi:hypothetical protein HYW83_01275 [Candidatus Peregrinibacteria bacterium]|nr:hypothetical protein [Candidatus Peregrinibacteria bacterium]
MKTDLITMDGSKVRKGFGIADAARRWLEDDNGGKRYRHIGLVQLIAAVVGNQDEAYKPNDQSIATRIRTGVQYVARVAGERIVADAISLDEQVMAAFNNSVTALFAPSRFTDATQRQVWNPQTPLATANDLLEVLNAFGQMQFAAGDVEQYGAAILAIAAGVGTAEGKTLRNAYTLTATGSLTEVNLREIADRLQAEGSAIESLGDDTCAALHRAGNVAFANMPTAKTAAAQPRA